MAASVITEPWAVDADGEAVRTAYKLSGNAIVQTIQHSGAAYPVVADPTVSLAWAIYVRWNLADDVEDAVEDADDVLRRIGQANCGIVAGGMAWLFNLPGVIIGAAYCIGIGNVVDNAQDALEDI